MTIDQITIFAVLAALLIIAAQFTYILHIFQRKIKPSALSWSGWFILMFVALYAQIVDSGWNWSITGFSIATFGCGFIAVSSLITKQFSYRKRDWFYFYLGLSCAAVYMISGSPWLTTIASILADLIIGIPTLIKVYQHPVSEKTRAWSYGLISWVISLILSFDQDPLFILFPAYLVLFNVTMIIFSNRKIKEHA